VAVKRIIPASENSAEVLGKLERELSQLVPHLLHPCILPVYGLLETDHGEVFLVSQRCKGSLAGHVLALRNAGQLMPRREVFRICRGVLSALAFLHSRECPIVYRDLKPSNVLLDDNGGIFLDSEFGVVRALLDLLAAINTRTSPPEGGALDAAYLACELLEASSGPGAGSSERAAAEQPACDIYSFSLLLYAMATGRPPFAGLREVQVVQCLLGKERPPLPERLLPPQLRQLIASCWQSDPAARPTARQLLLQMSRLEAELEGLPEASSPATAAEVRVSVPRISLATGLPLPALEPAAAAAAAAAEGGLARSSSTRASLAGAFERP
jgi:serine/threonine protein kinase